MVLFFIIHRVLTSVFLLSSRLRRGQMKEASEMKYGDQVEGVCVLLYWPYWYKLPLTIDEVN